MFPMMGAVVSLAVIGWFVNPYVDGIISTVRRITRSRTSNQQEARPPEEMSLNSFALLQAYILMAVTGLGYLALTWSTVVLLGGFVSSLGKEDFWCLTAISMVQAARIFNDSGENLFPIFLKLTGKLARKVFINPFGGFVQRVYRFPTGYGFMTVLGVQTVLFVIQILSAVALVVVLVTGILYFLGPVACIGLSIWRIRQCGYRNDDKDSSKANLKPALEIFYSLVICQGGLFFLWSLDNYAGRWFVVSFCEECKLPEKWGSKTILEYLSETRAKCWKDPASINGRNLIHYAVELVGSESQKDYLSGARMLDNFIKLEADVRSLLLPSRPKIQKLIDTLGWRSSDREIRELVARIVAHLAGDIHLSQFPGAIRCISSLLDTTLPYWSKSKENYNLKGRLLLSVKGVEKRGRKEARNQEGGTQQAGVDSSIHGRYKGDGWNELILQGLTILERLADDQQNCSDICRTPGLLPKIMTPLYSTMLIEELNASAWTDVVNGSLKVVHKLTCAPGSTGRRLRREISSSRQAVNNLEGILNQNNNDCTELRMRAIEILTVLAFDPCTNLSRGTKENLIEKQVQIFLTEDQGEEQHATNFIELKVMAGKTLELLSKTELFSQTGSIAEFVTSKYSNIVDGLTKILDVKNKIIYRTTAAEILVNLFIHRTTDKKHMQHILLPKVLTELLSSKGELQPEPSERNTSQREGGENQEHPTWGNDEENQPPRQNRKIKTFDQENDKEIAVVKFQEALLSLALAICCKLIIAYGVSPEISIQDGGFVGKLKKIVEENCQAKANCLRTVKLCGQIASLMMLAGQNVRLIHLLQYEEFVESFSMASAIMSNLESCMLFAGTDCGANNTVRPLLSDLEKLLKEAV